jgi:hypothetical protein
MMDSKPQTVPTITFGEAAVNGLLAGMGAGVLMAVYLILSGWAQGETTAAILERFDPRQAEPSPLTGLLTHLAVAGVYGLLFGAGWRLTPRRWQRGPAPVFGGLAFGLGLFVLAETVFLPGAASTLRAFSVVHFAIAHLVYGLMLGALSGRMR